MSEVVLPFALLLGFISVVVLVQGGVQVVFARHDRRARVNRRLAMFDAGLSRDEIYERLTRRGPQGAEYVLLANAEKALRRLLQQAGVTIPIRRLVLNTAVAAASLWGLALVFASARGVLLPKDMALSLLASLGLATGAVWMWLRRRRARRLKQIELQMPVALDVMTRALRAGHPVISAIQLAAEEMGDPLGSEFGLVLDETTYGTELREALVHFGDRSGSSDAHFLAVAVAVQTETGGNLAEILDGLAAVIRGRTSLTQKVKALSSEGRTSALFLTALPAVVIGGQILFHPHVYSDKFSDPIFWPAVGGTSALYLVGWLIIHRIINFKY